jgi:hypothetical protein
LSHIIAVVNSFEKLAETKTIFTSCANESSLGYFAEPLGTTNRLEEMSRLYAEVAADLRTLYTIEYQPTNDKRDGKWREIKIETSNPELISRTRQGYYAK